MILNWFDGTRLVDVADEIQDVEHQRAVPGTISYMIRSWYGIGSTCSFEMSIEQLLLLVRTK